MAAMMTHTKVLIRFLKLEYFCFFGVRMKLCKFKIISRN